MEFETHVLPVAERYARQRLKDDERVAVALVLAWWIWSNRQEDFPASVYARIAVLRVLRGDDLPGLRTKGEMMGDPFRRLERWEAGPGLADRRPGPEKEAMRREEMGILRASLSGRQKEMLEAVREDEGLGTNALAQMMGVSPGRISQLRRELMERAGE
jgi:hypothetical protein